MALRLALVACALARDVVAFAPAVRATRATPKMMASARTLGDQSGYADAKMEQERRLAEKTVASTTDPTNPLNVVGDLLVQTEDKMILTMIAESGLLSKLEAAGFTFADLEPLLYMI